jgi:hypothetical protein
MLGIGRASIRKEICNGIQAHIVVFVNMHLSTVSSTPKLQCMYGRETQNSLKGRRRCNDYVGSSYQATPYLLALDDLNPAIRISSNW